MNNMVQIDTQSAERLAQVFEDIVDMNARAKCSDGYFRKHFVMLATHPAVNDAVDALKAAIAVSKAESV